ncbi:MAG: capsule assembly Wzi family protein [Muribaculaceae bacterium]|nr:capsule assembly Wzi family protein [Muribaculaceae bacterium]
MSKLYRFLLALTLLITAGSLNVAAEWNDSIRWKAEIGAAFSGGEHTPFWIANNNYGLSSVKKNNAYLRLAAFHDLDTTKRFTWGAGADLAVAARFSSVFVVQQLYGEVKYRCLNLLVGSKELSGFITNSDLGSGNMMFSGNARPIPQVRAGIFDYADVWGTKGWFGVKGYVAFGMFTDNRWIKSWVAPDTQYTLNTLYHSKAIAFRVGNTNVFPLDLEIGMEMATQFGGDRYQGDKLIRKMPHGWKNWIKAVIPMKGGSDTPDADRTNVEGNMLGAWNFALAWKPQADWKIKAYYEHFFEDHSMMTFDYPWKDGLWGIEAHLPKNRWVSEVVYEFLYTKDQSGAVYWDHNDQITEQVSGVDNYYNNYNYNGWQNWGMAIGNPLLVSPIYNRDHLMLFECNRVWAHHLGVKGNPTDEIGYRLLTSYSKGWGTYEKPYPNVKSNFNLLAEVNWKPKSLKGWEGSFGFGMDAGSMLGNSYGVSLKISKTGWFLK